MQQKTAMQRKTAMQKRTMIRTKAIPGTPYYHLVSLGSLWYIVCTFNQFQAVKFPQAIRFKQPSNPVSPTSRSTDPSTTSMRVLFSSFKTNFVNSSKNLEIWMSPITIQRVQSRAYGSSPAPETWSSLSLSSLTGLVQRNLMRTRIVQPPIPAWS